MRYNGHPPHLTPAIIRLTQIEVIGRALGEPSSDFPSRLEIREGNLFDPRTSSYLAEWVPKPGEIKSALMDIIQAMISSDEARNLAHIHRELVVHTNKTRDQLEDYLLLHHIPGRCDLCKKLGGQ